MPKKRRGARPERARTDESLREERAKTDVAIKRDRKSAERGAEGVIDQARMLADSDLKAERKKVDLEARLPPRPPRKGALKGARARADRSTRGQRASVDGALRRDLEHRSGALQALLVLERDATDAYLLTERVRSDEEVSNRDDFLGMVAHDVRNLLNGVVLTVELLVPRGGDPGSQPAAAGLRIRRYVARMNRLIGDLVDVTSIDAGRLAVEPTRADAVALVNEATETFQPAALEKGVSLSAEVPGAPLLARFDHDRMLQVFANLIANAIKFTPEGGKIRVGVERARGGVRFRVSDTGVGIPPAKLGRIFERFWQVGKNDNRGMGLGLYISRSIVEAHGGRIWAESVLGKGSQLLLTLPARKPAKGSKPVSSRAPARAAQRKKSPRKVGRPK